MKNKIEFLKGYINNIAEYFRGNVSDFYGYAYRISEYKSDSENRDQLKYAYYELDGTIEELEKIRDQLQDLLEVENLEAKAKESSGK